MSEVVPKKTGWRGPPGSINTAGRKKKTDEDRNKEKKSNREQRSIQLLNLIRKFVPLQTKAIQAAAKILDNKESNDASKLRASALIIGTYRDLLKDLYDYRYDEEEGESITEDPPAPKFSLKMLEED